MRRIEGLFSLGIYCQFLLDDNFRFGHFSDDYWELSEWDTIELTKGTGGGCLSQSTEAGADVRACALTWLVLCKKRNTYDGPSTAAATVTLSFPFRTSHRSNAYHKNKDSHRGMRAVYGSVLCKCLFFADRARQDGEVTAALLQAGQACRACTRGEKEEDSCEVKKCVFHPTTQHHQWCLADDIPSHCTTQQSRFKWPPLHTLLNTWWSFPVKRGVSFQPNEGTLSSPK